MDILRILKGIYIYYHYTRYIRVLVISLNILLLAFLVFHFTSWIYVSHQPTINYNSGISINAATKIVLN